MTIDNKIKDWLDLANVVETIRTSRGVEQSKALDMYMTKSLSYSKTYGERFNPLQKPK